MNKISFHTVKYILLKQKLIPHNNYFSLILQTFRGITPRAKNYEVPYQLEQIYIWT